MVLFLFLCKSIEKGRWLAAGITAVKGSLTGHLPAYIAPFWQCSMIDDYGMRYHEYATPPPPRFSPRISVRSMYACKC